MHTKTFGICENCLVNQGKYRCPRCNAVSCSLKCCNEHKSKAICNGIKDKIDFLPLTKMNGNSLRRDMRFLSNLSSKIHVSSREPLFNQQQDRQTNNRFHSLCSTAKSKQIRLFLQPQMMAKHRDNQTFVTKNDQKRTIHWTLSVQFGSNQYLLHGINENETLLSVLRGINMRKTGDEYDKYLNDINLIRLPSSKPTSKRQKKELNSEQIVRSVIEESVLCNLWNIVSIKEEQKMSVVIRIPNHFMFIRVDPCKPILSILRQKIITEYPEFLLLLPSEGEQGGFVIVDFVERQQFANLIRHNTKIHQQRKKLKVEMENKLNEKKLFHRDNRNQQFRKNGYKQNGNRRQNENGLKAKDLFNGNIANDANKRKMNRMNNSYGQPPAMKRMRYNQTGNQGKQNNDTNWYLYM